MLESGKSFHSLSYSHSEIEELLKKIASGNVLKADDYDKLINGIGLDNISTFTGEYYDLGHLPILPSHLKELEGYYDIVDRLDYLADEINGAYNKIEDEIRTSQTNNNKIFVTQSDIDNKLKEIGDTLKKYVESQIAKQNITTTYATKTALTEGLRNKSNKEHTHEISDIFELQKELTTFKVRFSLLDKEYASKLKEHIHDNKEAIDMITKGQIEKWNAYDDQLDAIRSTQNELAERISNLEKLIAELMRKLD